MLSSSSGLQVEVEGMREAHLRDAVALFGLLAFLEKEVHLFTACTQAPLFIIDPLHPCSSLTPPHPFSIYPPCTRVPLYPCSPPARHLHPCTPVFMSTCTPVHHYPSTPVHHYPCTPVTLYPCTPAPFFIVTSAPLFIFTPFTLGASGMTNRGAGVQG